MIAAKLCILDLIKKYGFLRFNICSYNSILNRHKYLVSLKCCLTYVISDNYAKLKLDSHDSLPLEKTTTFNNVIIFIKSVWHKEKNNYCYNIFFEKASYELSEK